MFDLPKWAAAIFYNLVLRAKLTQRTLLYTAQGIRAWDRNSLNDFVESLPISKCQPADGIIHNSFLAFVNEIYHTKKPSNLGRLLHDHDQGGRTPASKPSDLGFGILIYVYNYESWNAD